MVNGIKKYKVSVYVGFFFFSVLEPKYDKPRLQQQIAINYNTLNYTLFAMYGFLGYTES